MLAGSQLQAYFSFTICLYFVWNSLARTHSANRVSQWPHTVQNHRSHSISVSTFELDLFLRPFYLLFIYSRLNSAVSLVQPESLVWLSKLLSVQDESDEETVLWWREEKKIEAKSPRKTYKTLCRATRIQRTRSFHKKMSQNYVQFIIIITISYCFHLGRFQISQRPGGNRTRVMIIGAHFLCAFCSFYSESFRLPWPLAMVHAQWPYDQLILVSLWATCTRAFIQSYIFGIVHFKNEMSRHQFRPSLWLCLCLIFLFSPVRSLIIKNWFTLTWNAPIFDCSVQRESKKYVCVCVFSLLGAGSIHANIVALQTHWCECSHCAPWTMRRVGKTSQHMNDGMNNSSRAQIFEHFYSFFFSFASSPLRLAPLALFRTGHCSEAMWNSNINCRFRLFWPLFSRPLGRHRFMHELKWQFIQFDSSCNMWNYFVNCFSPPEFAHILSVWAMDRER